MHLHRSGAHGIALILTILALTCEISWASKQCKSVVRDVHMKNCRGFEPAERVKRSLERLDLQKYVEKYGTKRQEGSDYSKTRDSALHGVPQKRQLSPRRIGDIALPIVAEAMNGAVKARTYATSETEYYDTNPSLMRSVLGLPEHNNYLGAPYLFAKGFVPFHASAFNNDLDLDLNNEELDELYNDIYKRLPRASKDEAWKVFLETASKCCQNVNRCLKETMHVPCLGNQMF